MSEYRPFYQIRFEDCVESVVGVYIKRPQMIGLVESDSDGLKNIERMKYFKAPKKEMYPLDLNRGFNSYIHRSTDYFNDKKMKKVTYYLANRNEDLEELNTNLTDNEASAVANVVEALSDLADPLASNSSKMENSCSDELSDKKVYEVITHRNVLSALMQTPVQRFANEWRILATQYNNKLYLAMVKSVDDNRHTPQSTHHFKFGQYCFTTDPKCEPDINVPVNENNQIYGIFKTHLGNISITYSAEIDGIASPRKLSNINDMDELRQYPLVYTKLMKEGIRNWMKNYRVLGWWVKCYIAAVEDLYVGFKSNDGFVQQPLRHIKVNQLPRDQSWSPKVCNTFVHTFITKVMEVMRGVNDLYSSYEFFFNPRTKNITYRIHEGITEYSILPHDYVEFIERTS